MECGVAILLVGFIWSACSHVFGELYMEYRVTIFWYSISYVCNISLKWSG